MLMSRFSLVASRLGIGILLLLEASSVALAQPLPTRRPYAFNGGVYNPSRIQEAVAAGGAMIVDTAVGHRVQHQRIEVIDRDASSSAQLITVFALCETAWKPAWDGSGRIYQGLAEVVHRYVQIDAYGQPIGAGVATYRSGARGWYKNSQELSVEEFYKQVPQHFRDSLHIVSGFLVNNPGRPIVPLSPSPDQRVAELMTKILFSNIGNVDLAADIMLSLMFEDAVVDEIKKQVGKDAVRFGAGEELDSQLVTEANRNRFGTDGRALWPGSMAPSPPSSLRIIR